MFETADMVELRMEALGMAVAPRSEVVLVARKGRIQELEATELAAAMAQLRAVVDT